MKELVAPLVCLLILGGGGLVTAVLLQGQKTSQELPTPPVTWGQLYKSCPKDDLYERLTDENYDPCLGEDD